MRVAGPAAVLHAVKAGQMCCSLMHRQGTPCVHGVQATMLSCTLTCSMMLSLPKYRSRRLPRVLVTHGNLRDSVAIAASLLLIVLASVLLGTALPFGLVKAGVDPAHAGSSIQVRRFAQLPVMLVTETRRPQAIGDGLCSRSLPTSLQTQLD